MRTAILCLLLAGAALAEQALVPPTGFEVRDRPNDDGKGLVASWGASPSEAVGVRYILSWSDSANGPWTPARDLDSTKWHKEDAAGNFYFTWVFRPGVAASEHAAEFDSLPDPTKKGDNGEPEPMPLEDGKTYWFQLSMTRGAETAVVGTLSAVPGPNVWNWNRTTNFLFAVAFCGTVLGFIRRARTNPNLFVRRIPGLDAVDEAIGRATEMGKPVLYLNGLYTMGDISTIASVSILGKLSRRIAQYDSQILVPSYDPVVMSVCQEVVREAYIDAGRPDAFREENVFFLTNDQFSYVAAVDGIMMRDRPAANFYMGYYFAESLLLAETGAATGAIQIAGTDSVTQLPFFIATCDYTLIGEELYAASAYLSREPLQLGSLKGQDVGKGFIMTAIVFGSALSTAAFLSGKPALDLLTRLFATF